MTGIAKRKMSETAQQKTVDDPIRYRNSTTATTTTDPSDHGMKVIGMNEKTGKPRMLFHPVKNGVLDHRAFDEAYENHSVSELVSEAKWHGKQYIAHHNSDNADPHMQSAHLINAVRLWNLAHGKAMKNKDEPAIRSISRGKANWFGDVTETMN